MATAPRAAISFVVKNISTSAKTLPQTFSQSPSS